MFPGAWWEAYDLYINSVLTPLRLETLLGGTNLLEVSIGRDFGALKRVKGRHGPGLYDLDGL